MDGEFAGNGTTPAPDPPLASDVDERLLEALLTYALNVTSAARPRNRSNGQQRAAPAAAEEEGLSGLIKLGAESAVKELGEPVRVQGGEPPPKFAPPKEGKPTHLARSRYVIALCSVALLTFVVVAAFVTIWRGENIDNLTRVLEIIFAPIVAVVAAAVAFYYRSSSL